MTDGMMNGGLLPALAILAALGSGLMAGTFFAFSTFVMKGLGRLPAAQGIAAMQSINVTVLNPWFFAAFFGTALLCLAVGLLALIDWSGRGSALLLAGSLLYPLGTIGVTMVGNVPLNTALAAVAAGSSEGASLWTRYLATWTAWNHVRTVAPLAAMAAFMLALL